MQYCALITVVLLSKSLTSYGGAGSLCVHSTAPQKRRNTKADIARSVRAAKEVFNVPHRHSKCPYEYEVKDGHLFIEGEDYGDAEEAFALGEKLVAFTHILHEVAMS